MVVIFIELLYYRLLIACLNQLEVKKRKSKKKQQKPGV